MQARAKVIVLAVGTLALCGGISGAQDVSQDSAARPPIKSRKPHNSGYRTLGEDDRSSLIAVALHSKNTRHAGRDCSHLVHSIYQRAGFPYPYADSEDLYAGATSFQRVAHPRAADLVVWHGHVGIVIRPGRHQFFSLLSTGPGIADYRSHYWKSRGQPRFYRYVKSAS
jgi:cell wall-associated NlpC family hydrolase